MIIDTSELRRLLDEARLESGFGNRAQWADENGDALLDAADRLARIEAALAAANPEAIALAILNSDRAMAGLPPTDSRANCPDSNGYVINATAALAALRELIGGV